MRVFGLPGFIAWPPAFPIFGPERPVPSYRRPARRHHSPIAGAAGREADRDPRLSTKGLVALWHGHDRAEDAGLPRTRARRGPDTTIQRRAETRVCRDRKISFRTEFLQTAERGLHRWRSSRRFGCRGSFPSQRRARKTPSRSACRYRGARGAEEGQK